MTEGALMTLTDAAAWLDPSGKLSARSLKTESERGRLELIKIAGKHFVTEDALKEMIEKCRGNPKARDSMYTGDQAGKQSGSFGMDRTKKAQAAVRATAAVLKERSRRTSPKNTSHPGETATRKKP